MRGVHYETTYYRTYYLEYVKKTDGGSQQLKS
jgi:hypothetical protein